MRVYLIKASGGSEFSKYKAKTGGPPQNIFSTAACTPANVEIEMCDETIGMKADNKSKADVVAIFMSTPDAIRAYEIADSFRSSGKIVVLGGLHTKFMQAEASKHADTLLIGEVEGIWEDLLNDALNGTLKLKYERTTPLNLAELKPYPTNLIPIRKYNYTWSVVVSRGCIHKCDFCLVPRFSGQYRYRPIQNIVDEVRNLKKLGVTWVELHSDTLTANREYIIELLEALAPLNMKFYGETTILVARDEQLLKTAQKAGLKALLFGIETPSLEALQKQGKGFVHPDEIKDNVSVIKSYGIEVWGDFLFGFDAHDTSIFQTTYDFINQIDVDESFPHLIIPFPGSETYKQMEIEGRILTKDWSKYNGSNAVFMPKGMTPQELEEGLTWIWNKQSIWKILYRDYDSEVTQKKSKSENSKENKEKSKGGFKFLKYWRSILSLSLISIGFILNIYWVWGIIFLIWIYSDLKNGYTYLMEFINKKEAPVLYWTVVFMWLFLAVTSFFPSFVFEEYFDYSNKSISAKLTTQHVSDTSPHEGSDIICDLPELSQVVSDEDYRYSFVIPVGWNFITEDDNEMQYVTISDNEGYFSITFLAFSSKWKLSLSDIQTEIEKESSKELPFFDFSLKKSIEISPKDEFSQKRFIAYKLTGNYQKADVNGIICYKANGYFAYNLIAVYPSNDAYSTKLIRNIVEKLVFNEK